VCDLLPWARIKNAMVFYIYICIYIYMYTHTHKCYLHLSVWRGPTYQPCAHLGSWMLTSRPEHQVGWVVDSQTSVLYKHRLN
jgi:hypothetical protein